MNNRTKNTVIIILILIILIIIFLSGFYLYPKVYPPPVFTSSHTVVYDTAKKHIYSIWPWYVIEQKDSIIYNEVPANIDTAEILARYYATFQYNRQIEDSNLLVKWQDNISQNKPMPVDGFDYVWKKPQNINNQINNSVNYSKYLYIAGTFNIPDAKYSDVSLFYASRRTILGFGYVPFQNGLKVTIGTTLFKIK